MAGTSSHGFEVPRLPGRRVLIVEARYHTTINDMLLDGARGLLRTAEVAVSHLVVAGALEIPPAIARAQRGTTFDAYVAIGCVIRGETAHFDLVAGESCRGIMDLGVHHGLAVGNGILTVESEGQAIARADPRQQDKGGHAALAALLLLDAASRLA